MATSLTSVVNSPGIQTAGLPTNSTQLGGGGVATSAPTPAGNNPVPTTPTNGTSSSGVLNPPTPSNPSVTSLVPAQPTTATFTGVNGTAATVGTATNAATSDVGKLADISSGSANPNDSTNSASQLDAITSTDSPYMQLARKQGMLSAASRGLGNSSIAAGNSEASAVAAAAPLAEQNASTAASGQLQNSQLDTQTSEFNAGQQNANAQLDAQLKTQTSQFNASQQQSTGATNAAAINAMREQTQAITAQLNTQFLSGSMAQTLAGIQGQYSELIAQNQSAAALVQSTLNGISAAMANPQVNATQASQAIAAEIAFMNSSLGMINILNGGSPNALSAGIAAPGSTPTANPGGKK